MKWRDYQNNAARFFIELGYDAVTDATVVGARGRHAVDVLVRFRRHHFDCLWIVECKLWKSAVPKEKMLAFREILEDTGADKGIFLSESGFQRGALACAHLTNILPTSLTELCVTNLPFLHEAFVDRLIQEFNTLEDEINRIAPLIQTSSPGANFQSWTSKFPISLAGKKGVIKRALLHARNDKFPVLVGYEQDGHGPRIIASSMEELLLHYDRVHREVIDWLRANRNPKSA